MEGDDALHEPAAAAAGGAAQLADAGATAAVPAQRLTKKTTVAELKRWLISLGLPTTGKKEELYDRLVEYGVLAATSGGGGAKRKHLSSGRATGSKRAKRTAAANGGRAALAQDGAIPLPLAPAWLSGRQQPPAAIRYSDGQPVPHPGEFFASKEAGEQAVARHPSMDLALHAGSVTMRFKIPHGESVAALLRLLSPAVKCTPRVCGRTDTGDLCVETWRKVGETSGEPPCAAGELAILAQVEAAVADGSLVPEEEWCSFWLQAAASLVRIPGSPWKAPLIRVICAAPRASDVGTSGQLELTMHVFVLRMLFYLIAYEPLSTVLKHLRPPVPVVTPCYVPPRLPEPCFTRANVEGRDRFTLEGLLRSREHIGYPEISVSLRTRLDAQLSKTLKKYQSQTVAWMLDQERMPGGLNSLFWETRQWGGGGHHEYYYAPQLGELRLERPPVVRGGLLCDEMGLGKTLEIIALIVATSSDDLQPPPVDRDDITVSSRASLIVVPEPLLAQWKEEIAGSTQPAELLSVIKCTGAHPPATRRVSSAAASAAHPDDDELQDEFDARALSKGDADERQAALEALAENDVVLTTYRGLERLAPYFKRVHWKRVVLDEMQEVRSSTTALARLCEKLSATTRWMVSGTPLYEGIDDLNGELNFLQIWPFALRDAEDGFWHLKIGQPWERKEPLVLDKLELLLGGVMMRHSKTQTNTHDGRSILELPPITTRHCAIKPTESEAATTAFLESLSVKLLRHTNVIEDVIAERAEAQVNDEGGEEGDEEDGGAATAAAAGRPRANRGGGRRRRGGGVIDQLLKLQRQACTAAALIAGGSGCRNQLKDVDNLLRRVMALGQATIGGAAAVGGVATAAGPDQLVAEMQRQPINKAYEDLMQGQQRQQLRQNADFEWTSNATLNMYHTGGWRQTMTAVERRDEATTRQAELAHRLAAERSHACQMRWRWAVEQVSSGRGLSLLLVLPPARNSLQQLQPWRHNPVAAYFNALPLRLLRKVIQHEKLAREMRRAVQVLAVATAEASALSDSGLARALGLSHSEKEIMSANRARRNHYEKMYVAQPRERMMKLRTEQPKESPIGWRRPEQTQNIDPIPGVTSAAAASRTGRKIRGEGQGLDLFKHYPTEARQTWESAKKIAADLESLQPWVAVCESAAEAEEAAGGANAVVTDQSGFQDIQALMDSSASQIINCPICLEPLKVSDGPKQPVVTRCIHLFCSVCIEAHMSAFRVVNVHMAADAECQCPICRRAIRTNELVILQPRDDEDSDAPATTGGSAPDQADPRGTAAVAGTASAGAPRLTLAADDAGFQAIPLPRGPLLPLLPQFPAVPSRFLTHLSEASGVLPGSAPTVTSRPSGRSSKMLQLLADLDRVLYKPDRESPTGGPSDVGGGLRGKAVVFSQHKSVIQHASFLLQATGVRHVSICPGDNQQALRDAVATFNSDQSCGVFLLHAGTAAAGLTLTAARHVFLLEPFLSAAEEAQAMNRAHRIGQKHRAELLHELLI